MKIIFRKILYRDIHGLLLVLIPNDTIRGRILEDIEDIENRQNTGLFDPHDAAAHYWFQTPTGPSTPSWTLLISALCECDQQELAHRIDSQDSSLFEDSQDLVFIPRPILKETPSDIKGIKV